MSERPTLDLLRDYGSAIDALMARGVVRTKNVVGCYAEHLFATAFGWQLQRNSSRSYDAVGGSLTYQVKARRISPMNRSRQLGDLPPDDEIDFDILAGVIFNQDFEVTCAALIPIPVLLPLRTGAPKRRRFHLRDTVLSVSGVQDVTDELRAAQN